MAKANSRIRAAGLLHSIEKRFSMCGLIWLPRPRTNRPFEYACRSHAVFATVIGDRENATAIDVPISRFSVCSAASSNGRNGSCAISATQAPA